MRFLLPCPIHPTYLSLAMPMRMFESISRIRKLFDPASWFLAIKGFYKVEAIGVPMQRMQQRRGVHSADFLLRESSKRPMIEMGSGHV